MAFDPYSSCPCGSGKKFKWCCQPIHVQIDKAFRQEEDGQHEAALRTMDEVVAEHPGNPEAWGRRAQLLYLNSKLEEAEQALNKALEINPSYAFGHLLRGTFLQNEGEMAGALLLLRKAAELYDPEAHDHLTQVYAMITDAEMKCQRPVAARAAMKLAIHHDPANAEMRQMFDDLYGDQSRLPAAARRELTFQSPPASSPPERRSAWERALAGAATGKLSDAARAFEQLTGEDPGNSAAWYNLAVVRAWLGMNREALEALDPYVELETDPERAGAAWALGQVLRLGQGMEEESDYVAHSVTFQIRDPRPFVAFLDEFQKDRRLAVLQARQEEHTLMALVLDRVTALTEESARSQLPRLGAYLLVIGDVVRLWHTDREALDRTVQEVQQRSGAGLSEGRISRSPASFSDVLAETLFIPTGAAPAEETEQRLREHIQRHFEESWIHRPRRSLNGVAPVDAAGHPTLRKKLLGVIAFFEQCAAVGGTPYDFGRLRRKLGLIPGDSPTPADSGEIDIDALGAAQLAALDADALADEQLERAYQAAMKLDARELAGRFAQALVNRPARPERPDRFPWFSHLVQLALNEEDADSALDYLDEGEKHDCEENEGRRRNDYELRRGQIQARRGEVEAAQELFERLITRAPADLRYPGTAAEALLSARQGSRALRFAEQGLAKAREQSNRDSEEYYLELVAAAKKQLA